MPSATGENAAQAPWLREESGAFQAKTARYWWDITEKSLAIVCEPIVPLFGLIL